MKTSKTLVRLCWLLMLLVLISAGLGLSWMAGGTPRSFTTLHGDVVQIAGTGIYHNDTTFFQAGFRGADLVTLFLVLPLMTLAIWLYSRGSLQGGFLLSGSLVYILYNAFSLATSAAFNSLFLIYTAEFSLSLFGLVLLWAQIDFPLLSQRILPKTPHRLIAFYLIVAGSATALLWLSELLPGLLVGQPPVLVSAYTTAITYFIDLGLILPVCFLAGFGLLRGDGRSVLAGFTLLYLLAMIGFMVCSQTVFQISAGIQFSTGQLIGMIGSWIVMGALAISLAISILRSSGESVSQSQTAAHSIA